MEKFNRIDILAFSPHPDDAEMGCGGLLLKMKDIGYKTGIIDLTEGEMSTGGSPEIRVSETEEASKILGLDVRENLDLGDSRIENSYDNRLKVVNVIRKYKPKMAVIPFSRDRHPDHENSFKLLKDGIFISGLEKLKTENFMHHRPAIVVSYMLHYEFKPSFIVDISDYYSTKVKAVEAYKSQFYNDKNPEGKTYIASRYFYNIINNRYKCFGTKIFADYGEPYHIENEIKIDNPLEFFKYLTFNMNQ